LAEKLLQSCNVSGRERAVVDDLIVVENYEFHV
jgi:hypothetical protein